MIILYVHLILIHDTKKNSICYIKHIQKLRGCTIRVYTQTKKKIGQYICVNEDE